MGTYIILAVLVVIVIGAIVSSSKHFKGEGGCCGGGGELRENKKLHGKVIAQRIVHIEGMHCEHCQNTVEKMIDKIDGAAARVNLKKNIAVVSLDREVSDDDIKAAVEKAGFSVTSIEAKE